MHCVLSVAKCGACVPIAVHRVKGSEGAATPIRVRCDLVQCALCTDVCSTQCALSRGVYCRGVQAVCSQRVRAVRRALGSASSAGGQRGRTAPSHERAQCACSVLWAAACSAASISRGSEGTARPFASACSAVCSRQGRTSSVRAVQCALDRDVHAVLLAVAFSTPPLCGLPRSSTAFHT